MVEGVDVDDGPGPLSLLDAPRAAASCCRCCCCAVVPLLLLLLLPAGVCGWSDVVGPIFIVLLSKSQQGLEGNRRGTDKLDMI
jgi:hypothetical protein